ncbi:sensor domain-containing diguanylate cyclase [Aquabacter spiritensis]|uniref:diguanylate cyclase n=1 Tax=Aquabacter spiritensis TaxID=933073 RepID=A0A4V2UXP5_9HYPH|nr:sensor domain-containing diguanylate cyclase [Aquabacter spiritensis]TCT04288.1 diguanylate cyclase [Aquabacter spiritensis]
MSRSAPRGAAESEFDKPATPRIAHLLVIGTVLACLAILGVVGATLLQARNDVWQRAAQTSENMLHGVVGHIDRHMRLYAFGLGLAADALADAEVNAMTESMKQRMLTTIARSIDFVGSMLVLDAAGDIVLDSDTTEPRRGNFADRDYFTVHRTGSEQGTYVSQPYRSRLRNNDLSVALSRRLENPDGSFAGVVMIAIRLAYVDAFLSGMEVGSNGKLELLSGEGRLLAHVPVEAGGDIESSVSAGPLFQRMRQEEAGTYVATDPADGVERLFTFARVPNEMLIAVVGLSTHDLFADWWRRSLAIGAITLVACAAMLILALILHRELQRRAVAEADLAFLSVTDGLTGLANRRRFDEVIQREWRRTGRAGASLALLMIDVDRFKSLNDRHGHSRGDEVLKALARVIDGAIRRPGDLGARYGGEEFAVILPDTDNNAAMGIAETIRARCELLEAAGDGVKLPKFTVSIGVAALRPSPAASLDAMIDAADAALYRAKAEGRSRVVLAV